MKRDFFEEEDTRSRERYDDLRDGLQKAIGDFAEKLDIGPKMLALLLIDLGITYNTIDYVLSTAKPSALGLKRELDRLLREIGDFIGRPKRTRTTRWPDSRSSSNRLSRLTVKIRRTSPAPRRGLRPPARL
jgi:hypothetical protein